MRINYVIASWAGSRKLSKLDGAGFYVFHHLYQLDCLSKHLAQITIGHPYCDCPSWYNDRLAGLKSLQDGTPISVMPMENSGKSYGQLSRIYEATRGQFDYYIFMEDDYVPLLDDFDTILIRILEEDPTCGYLCSVYGEEQGRPSGAAVSTGVIRSKALRDIWEKFGCLPCTPIDFLEEQDVFSLAFAETQWKIKDYLSYYSSPYLRKETEEDILVVYGDPNKKCILGPIQMLNKHSLKFRRQFYKSGVWPFI